LVQMPSRTDSDRTITVSPNPLAKELCLEGVSFTYPGAQHPVFKNFSIAFKAGQITAIVGDNGAGKSTLCKLICRLYDPDQGRVTWDGEDLRAFPVDMLHREISVLLQEPVRYHASLRENIAFGDVERNPPQEEIESAVRAASASGFIQDLPKGYDTILGKWFGGAELSGGEWQRVAVARAFIRKASLILLDEPTSAMDSWSEAEWYRRFKELVRGRTALLITHRFTTAMQADLIYVMREGKVIESGSHAELVAGGGYYAHSWQAQMEAGRR
jgi:ATP-binding cassette, subfamily B, bacterial